MNFWTTWCPPCRKEFPELVNAHRERNGDVVVIGVDLQESPDEVRGFAKEFGATFPIVIDADGTPRKVDLRPPMSSLPPIIGFGFVAVAAYLFAESAFADRAHPLHWVVALGAGSSVGGSASPSPGR